MLRLAGLVISIGLVDSVNPTTVAPALYLASGERPRARVLEFTIAVFVVFLAGGALIAIGPGQIIRSLVPHPHRTLRQIGEIVAGVMLLVAAAYLWWRRDRLTARGMPTVNPKRRSSLVLGATISVVELPTAFPYFAAIAAIAASGYGPLQELGYLILFNICFVLPLLVILAILTLAPNRADRLLGRTRRFIEERWPHFLAGLVLVVGILALFLGLTGFAATVHGGFGRFFRRTRRVFHLHP